MKDQLHYDRATDAWTLILGQNFHYGYFTRGEETLAEGTSLDRSQGKLPSWTSRMKRITPLMNAS
jgi:hypothetical protein